MFSLMSQNVEFFNPIWYRSMSKLKFVFWDVLGWYPPFLDTCEKPLDTGSTPFGPAPPSEGLALRPPRRVGLRLLSGLVTYQWKCWWQLLNYVHLAAKSHEIWVCLPSFWVENHAPKIPSWLMVDHHLHQTMPFCGICPIFRQSQLEIPVKSDSVQVFTLEIPWKLPLSGLTLAPSSHTPLGHASVSLSSLSPGLTWQKVIRGWFSNHLIYQLVNCYIAIESGHL